MQPVRNTSVDIHHRSVQVIYVRLHELLNGQGDIGRAANVSYWVKVIEKSSIVWLIFESCLKFLTQKERSPRAVLTIR